MLVPVELNNQRIWVDVRVRYLEHRWFDDFGEFYTYIIEWIEATRVYNEKELLSEIEALVAELQSIDTITIDGIINEVVVQYGVSRKNAVMLLKLIGIDSSYIEI